MNAIDQKINEIFSNSDVIGPIGGSKEDVITTYNRLPKSRRRRLRRRVKKGDFIIFQTFPTMEYFEGEGMKRTAFAGRFNLIPEGKEWSYRGDDVVIFAGGDRSDPDNWVEAPAV